MAKCAFIRAPVRPRWCSGFAETGNSWKGHLNIIYSVKDFAAESLDLADLQVGPREFTFSDPSSAGINKNTIAFRGVKFGAELRGVAETKVQGKVEGNDYVLEVLGEWVLHREP